LEDSRAALRQVDSVLIKRNEVKAEKNKAAAHDRDAEMHKMRIRRVRRLNEK